MDYFVGVDLGQAQDFTAVAVLERQVYERAWAIRHLERLPLKTSYPDVVERIRGLMHRRPLLGNAQLVIDATGVGRAVFDIFRKAGMGCRVAGVTIHGGDAVTSDGSLSGYRVPQREIISTVQLLLQQRRLKIAPAIPAAELLIKELDSFQVRISDATAHLSFGNWRTGEHDDLVFAVGLAAWLGQRFQPLPPGPPELRPPVGQLVRDFFEGLEPDRRSVNPDDFALGDYRPFPDRHSPAVSGHRPAARRTTVRIGM